MLDQDTFQSSVSWRLAYKKTYCTVHIHLLFSWISSHLKQSWQCQRIFLYVTDYYQKLSNALQNRKCSPKLSLIFTAWQLHTRRIVPLRDVSGNNTTAWSVEVKVVSVWDCVDLHLIYLLLPAPRSVALDISKMTVFFSHRIHTKNGREKTLFDRAMKRVT